MDRFHGLTERLQPPQNVRHSYASGGLLVADGLPMIGKLLGHNDTETTARYTHLARDSIHDAAERIASSIATDIL